MLSILKVNDPLLERDGHSVWDSIYGKTPKKTLRGNVPRSIFRIVRER